MQARSFIKNVVVGKSVCEHFGRDITGLMFGLLRMVED